jgi:hypothetical protein
MTKQKYVLGKKNKYYIYITIQTLYFVESSLAEITASIFLGMMLQAWHTSQALLGWMGSVAVQLFSGLSRDVQVWALAGPLKDIQRLVPKPLLLCLGCVLRVLVLLEGEPSPQSEVLLLKNILTT